MKPGASWSLAFLSIGLSMAAAAPNLGGTLRVQLRELPSVTAGQSWPDEAFTVASDLAPGKRIRLEANLQAPKGRPFVDAIEITPTGSGTAADVIELAPTTPVRSLPEGYRLWTAPPRELIAISGDLSSLIRSALSLSIDRSSLASVLLQRRAHPAWLMLPDWLTGYAQVFATERDVPKASSLLSAVRLAPLDLGYPANDPLLRLIAERVALNAREAGILLRPKAGATTLTLKRLDFAGSDPLTALGIMLGTSARLPELQSVLDAERELTGEGGFLPLVHLQRSWALSPRVRMYRTNDSGDLSFPDLWLTPPPAQAVP
jgi:hypothetical protein